MAASNEQESPSSREDIPKRTHRRAVHSVDMPGPLIPQNQSQYGTSRGSHRRQPSEQVHTAVPRHMRTDSYSTLDPDNFVPLVDPGLPPTGSPFLNTGTPDSGTLHRFPPNDPNQPLIGFMTPEIFQGGFAVPGQQPAEVTTVLSHGGTPLIHGGTPVIFDHAAFPQFSGILTGSPGPLVSMFSPNPRGLRGRFTGLTPLLNFSPYPESTQEAQGSQSATTPQTPHTNSERKTEKHSLDNSDSSSQSIEEIESPQKRKRVETQETERVVKLQSPSANPPDEKSMEVPSGEYSDEAMNHAWTDGDISELVTLLEVGERFKWRYMSDQFYNEERKRIPGIACSKKFKDLFGVPEASSRLGSSLFYLAYRDGWSAIKDYRTHMELDKGNSEVKQDDGESLG